MITIMQGERFKLESAGNGAVYLLTDTVAGRDVALQGDEALQFEADLDIVERLFQDDSTDYVLSWLWNQCVYGSASSAVERI